MLTDKKIKDIKPSEKVQVICDSDGLYVEILPSGRKNFYYRTRKKDPTSGKLLAKRKTLGSFPDMGLYKARMARDALKKKDMATGDEMPFRVLAQEWLDKKCIPTTSAKNVLRQSNRLKNYVLPVLGNVVASEVKAAQVLTLVRALEDKGLSEVPTDVKQLIGMILRYGVSIGKCERDVTVDLRGALIPRHEVHRAAIREPLKVGGLMRAIYELPPTSVRRLLLFTAYTFARPTEARLATWEEIDIERAEWRIPAERMKMRRPHIVPLSTQALDIIREAEQYGAKESPYLFPALRLKTNPLSDMAALASLRRIGYSREEMSVHGFRAMASTALYEAGWLGTAIERQLAHVDGNEVRAAYNYAEHLDLRRSMMQWYADYLDALRDGQPTPPIPQQVTGKLNADQN